MYGCNYNLQAKRSPIYIASILSEFFFMHLGLRTNSPEGVRINLHMLIVNFPALKRSTQVCYNKINNIINLKFLMASLLS